MSKCTLHALLVFLALCLAWVWCLLEQSTGMDPTVVSGDGRNRAPNWGNLAWKEYCFFSPDVKETKTTTLPLTASKKRPRANPNEHPRIYSRADYAGVWAHKSFVCIRGPTCGGGSYRSGASRDRTSNRRQSNPPTPALSPAQDGRAARQHQGHYRNQGWSCCSPDRTPWPTAGRPSQSN